MNAKLKTKVEKLLDEMLRAPEVERREAIFMVNMNFCNHCGKQLDRIARTGHQCHPDK